jgi:adenylate cyclase
MVEAQEREAIQEYVKEKDVEEILRQLVEGLLKDRPGVRPKEHWAHMLRLDQIKQEHPTEFDFVDEAKAASEVPGRLLSKLFEATKRITAEIVPSDTIKIIMTESKALLSCDRVSLFIYDKRLEMLVLNACNLNVPIRVKPGQGIAGHVFTTQEVINIPVCYEDSRFDQTFDKMTGYVTKHLLTMPIVDHEGDCMGVLQAINKLEDEFSPKPHFTHIDEILIENLTQHVCVALRNAEVYRAAIVTSERANALLHMIQSLSQDLGMQSTILTITMHANELVQADRCTVFLVDEGKEQLWSVSTDSGKEIRIPKSAGIAGECAMKGDVIAIPDCYADSRFNQAIDKQTGYKTTSMLAIPVLRKKRTKNIGHVLAVIQMINKMEFDGEVGKFDDEDIQVMETFATFVASRLEGSALLEKTSHKKQDVDAEGHMAFDTMVDGHKGGKAAPRVDDSSHELPIAEEDECEDEDM